ncbi:MAG TPA: polysaccharide biosynthesis/export family protein [Longimicrobiaceae bacterium]|nr:polysaccharide biosynthesis/export family protein [Longimicrobiaceae bacterium]
MIRLPLLLALWGLIFAGGALAQNGAPAPPQAVLQPGDRVGIVVWRNSELTGTFTVAADSSLIHPLYGAVKVAGVPIPAAQERVRQFLRGFEADPRITFTPEFRVYVGGAVRDPNQHYLPEISVGQAITRAGGSTAPNRTHRVRLIRNGTPTVANLNDPRISSLLQEPIRSGDQIIVEERSTFARTYIAPALQILQTVSSLVTTYIIINSVFGSDDDETP